MTLSSPLRLLRALAVAALALAWIAAAHLGSAGVLNADAAVALGLAPLVAAMWLLLWRTGRKALAVAGTLTLLALLLVLWSALRDKAAFLFYLQHLGANLALATVFGRTLLRGEEPLISRLSRLSHDGVLSAARARYTRRVTVAWTLFFLASALVSTALFWLAAPAHWSVFANVLTAPLVASMFLAEYLVRLRVLPAGDRSGLGQAIRAYRARCREAH
jgi:uncharacterized membrane protein